ncbi:hypothetical protein [Spiroplasma endosymbiont of Stenodema calcarata]|uniref:hypothetical protein n=1 Tax=Spiroplasma endosymbiont of Stenodema calcarata TaxID=3139328 RepID=UPI003CCAC4E1
MPNETLQRILQQKEIKITDDISFRTIFDVLSALFTDENNLSILTNGYTINNQQQVWLVNLSPPAQLPRDLNKGYANYSSPDRQYLYQFNQGQDLIKRKKLGAKHTEKNTQFVTFAKSNEKKQEIGYKFIGIFNFVGFSDEDCQTMIYKKIADNYHLPI